MQCDIGCEKTRIENLIRQGIWSSGTEGVVLGVSGGIDSAVVAALATASLGSERVCAFFLPSAATPPADEEDVRELCDKLGLELQIIPIDGIIEAYRHMEGFVDEPYLIGNLMARTRMTMLYYQANLRNRLVIGTSNRTEYLIGYCTKWGDNAADLQPILHLSKKEIYILGEELEMPDPIMKKEPSAGLWHGQNDEKEIGISYAELDSALAFLEENNWKAENTIQEKVLALVKKSAHKRLPALSLAGTDPRSP
ncbi:MAG: NH(3)-dependent NAD(+) synthetase [Methanomicrobiales archaeon 53_19]|jgi:NAD+ synthase|uniref:NAD+ synthase n=1 Tax=Methanocalculus sp. TaxID=2004547 RepID=UPI000746FC97|nr:NAD+ synthase [Methanocalculus sp.]KUK69554.1 MAG: NH(3)-dependent NAD(+) synthetase [Methanocalculus sp. 52_23]KUL03014.1 MAG: NH(3)-dependent NAD(+) synthetase [Methanomicrobiales archaeon 53_19]HIJ06195.1 NAD+ synthase [Methanocalculus sp.]